MIEIRFANSTLLGHAALDVDGFYYFLAEDLKGLWSEHVLRYIADKLDELNGPYNQVLKEYFDKYAL